jgi:hypothetical protein
VGLDEERQKVVLIEAKFEAGLTPNQPVGYLRQLRDSGLLLFVAPEFRLEQLWGLLERDCLKQALRFEEAVPKVLQFEANIDGRYLGLVSWGQLLDHLLQVAREGHDEMVSSALYELKGMCGHVESEIFRPFKREELTDLSFVRRLKDFERLVEWVVDKAAQREILRREFADSRVGYCGVYAYMGMLRTFVSVDFDRWRRCGFGTVWLDFKLETVAGSQEVRDGISTLRTELAFFVPRDPRLLQESKSWMAIPLSLEPGLEKSDLIHSLVSQIEKVRDRLREKGFPVSNAAA